jgi:hypothetical protein
MGCRRRIPANTLRQALKLNDLRTWGPTSPVLLCGGNSDPTVFFFDTQLMQDYWTANSPTSVFTVLDVDSAPTANDPYAARRPDSQPPRRWSGRCHRERRDRRRRTGGARDYHARLVPPFCLSAAKSFFDGF